MNRNPANTGDRGAAAKASGTDNKGPQPDELKHFIRDGGTHVVHMLCPTKFHSLRRVSRRSDTSPGPLRDQFGVCPTRACYFFTVVGGWATASPPNPRKWIRPPQPRPPKKAPKGAHKRRLVHSQRHQGPLTGGALCLRWDSNCIPPPESPGNMRKRSQPGGSVPCHLAHVQGWA